MATGWEDYWWVVEVVTHVGFLVNLGTAIYINRIEVAISLIFMIGASIHYHVCLGTEVCLGTLAHAASTDWFGSGLVSVSLSMQFWAFPPAIGTSILIYYTGLMALLYPVLPDATWAAVVLMSVLIMATLARSYAFRVPEPYPGGWWSYVGVASSIAAFALFIFPRSPKGSLYNGPHSLWHLLAAFVVEIILIILSQLKIQITSTGLVITRYHPSKTPSPFADDYPYNL